MFVIGTAGHVDHGKSTLVQALTGINPDRLPEEREREMTIDLGFAWLTLPSGRQVSIVDVPGHEDFIKNMLAGIGGIDVALLVVAADESVMPQTREHLAILDLLQIPQGVVALTKTDLIEEDGWLELVREELRQELEGTVLANAAIIPASAVDGSGLADLLAELDRILDGTKAPRDIGRPRLPIDRVFTISGFGTVVTGTLVDGQLSVGDEVRIVPGDLDARIRGLQTHKVKEQEVLPGSRVAINLSGVAVDQLWRGQVVTRPGWLEPTRLVDARLRLLSNAPWPLKHNAIVDLFSGSARVAARVRLLDADILEPGQVGWVQFRLAEPLAVMRGDRYIVRLASPSITLGGGEIVQPHPRRRHKRFRPGILARLEALARGTPSDVLLQLLGQDTFLEARELVKRSNLPQDEAGEALLAMIREERIVLLAEGIPDASALSHSSVAVASQEAWESLVAQMARVLGDYHRRYPLRSGMRREELKSRLRDEGQFFIQIAERAARDGYIVATPNSVRLAGHKVVLSVEQRQAIDDIMDAFRSSRFTPPSFGEVERVLGAELLRLLLGEGRLVKASDTVLFDAHTHAQMEQRLIAYLRENESITVAQFRDLFGTSRKYALGFLEDMDRRRVTKRMGDIRVLR